MIQPTEFIHPDWPAPWSVNALATQRFLPGFSQAPYDALNLAGHVGDDPRAVSGNRKWLREAIPLPAEPLWLKQVHGTTAINAAQVTGEVIADAAYTCEQGVVCAVMTADCLPVLLTHRDQPWVAAVHAGWRGMAGGIIERTLAHAPQGQLLAWLGPAIGADVFEVGEDVFSAFVGSHAELGKAFLPSPLRPRKWLLDIYLAARIILVARGVTEIYGGEFCTYSMDERFYSYRRDGQTGRMASLIWLS